MMFFLSVIGLIVVLAIILFVASFFGDDYN
jgi:hypothetical protein